MPNPRKPRTFYTLEIYPLYGMKTTKYFPPPEINQLYGTESTAWLHIVQYVQNAFGFMLLYTLQDGFHLQLHILNSDSSNGTGT